MYQCPNCERETVSFLRKWWSSAAAPATCAICGSRSAITSVDASGILVGATVVVTLCGFLAAVVRSGYPLLLGVCAAVFYYFWMQHCASLVHISEREFKTARRSNALMLLAAVFPSLFG
jgi:hypothetical protein